MTKKEVLKLLKYLDSYYEKNFELPTQEDDLDIKVNTYYDFLGEYPFELLMTATKKLISRKEWPPTPGEIAEEIENMKKSEDEKFTAGEAWEEVLQAIKEHSYFYNPDKVKNRLPDKAKRAAEVVGFEVIAREGNGNTYVFNSFKEAYNNLAEKREKVELLPKSVRREVNQLADQYKNPQLRSDNSG